MWKIYYDDEQTWAGNGPTEMGMVPAEGVIVVAQADAEVGRELLHMKDFYYWERGRWWGCDLYGLFDYLRRPGWKKVLAGRNVEHAVYHRLMERARTEPGLPAKTARQTIEEPVRA